MPRLEDPVLPKGWTYRFIGFGGTAEFMQTRVYNVWDAKDGVYEVRIPDHPDHFPPENVELCYDCFSGLTLADACSALHERLTDA